MPDRIIRDELLESRRWVGLKDNADRLAYIALLLKADAHGNFTADAWRLLRLWLDFGITTEQAVAKTLAELVDHDLVRLYEHDGTRYLHIPRYRQRLRYTARCLPRSPWCDTKQDQHFADNSPGDSQATDGRSPGAHRRRKEGSEVKEVKEGGTRAHATPVDNSVVKPVGDRSPEGQKLKPGWWKTDEGIEAAAKVVGVQARAGQTYRDLKDVIFRALHE